MPTQVVDVDLQSQTGAVAQRTYTDLLIIANDPTVSDPTYNEPFVFDDPSQVASEFGDGSDAHTASKAVAARGTESWWVIMLDNTAHTEVVGDSDTTSTDEGTVSTTPMRGGLSNITVTVDGTTNTVVPTVESPPTKPGETGTAHVNFDTGEVKTGASTSGSGSGIEVSYESLSWSTAFPDMTAGDFDITCLADVRADRSYIGELDELLTWAESDDACLVAAYENGDNYADDEAAMTAAHDIGGYLPSGSLLPIAHKASDDVASAIAGRLATKRPWFNPYMDGGASYGFSMNEYRQSLIGSPDSPGTFEGGDSNGAGPCNVLYTEMGTQILSNSLSTAGSSSNYQFFDVARTEAFIIAETKRALRSLRLSREVIPFAPVGRTLIEAALRKRLNQYVAPSGRALSPEELQQLRQEQTQRNQDSDSTNDVENIESLLEDRNRRNTGHGNVPLSELEISVPRFDDLSQSARANRVWRDIEVTAQLAGNAHTFNVDLAVQV